MNHEALATPALDLAAELRAGASSLGAPPPEGTPSMSETSIDGTLLLDTIGLEPADFVFGLGTRTFPYGMWMGAKKGDDFAQASKVVEATIGDAINGARAQASAVGAVGVVGLQIKSALHLHYVTVEVKGTAVRARKPRRGDPPPVFVTDLSARDLVLLDDAGWTPTDLTYGTCFAIVRWQSGVKYTENREMENMTKAIYLAREKSVEAMQRRAASLHSGGVVGTSISEELLGMLNYRVLGYRIIGTGVRTTTRGATVTPPQLTVSMDSGGLTFDVASLRGSSTNLLRYRNASSGEGRDLADSVTSDMWRHVRLTR